jgi:hypothetical protein
LECPDRRLGLGRKDAIDRAWVKPHLAQMRFRDLDISRGQEAVQDRPFRALHRCDWLWLCRRLRPSPYGHDQQCCDRELDPQWHHRRSSASIHDQLRVNHSYREFSLPEFFA